MLNGKDVQSNIQYSMEDSHNCMVHKNVSTACHE